MKDLKVTAGTMGGLELPATLSVTAKSKAMKAARGHAEHLPALTLPTI